MSLLVFILVVVGVVILVRKSKNQSNPITSQDNNLGNPERHVLNTFREKNLSVPSASRTFFGKGNVYRKRHSIMNKSEMAFFYELQKQIPKGYYIFPNMRIADFIDAVNGKGFYNRRNKILPKHIDFLICNSYFNPILAIELNGSSHQRRDRIERDILVREIFESAKLPLEIVGVGNDFSTTVTRIFSILPKNK